MRYSKVRDVKSPERGTDKSAGIDFFVPTEFDMMVYPHMDVLIPSGIVAEVPEGCMLMAADKSGIATSKRAREAMGVIPKDDTFSSPVILGAKIVDEDFQGEIFIHLINLGNHPVRVKPNMKIAQFIIVPVSYESLEEVPRKKLFRAPSERGGGALGSTGIY